MNTNIWWAPHILSEQVSVNVEKTTHYLLHCPSGVATRAWHYQLRSLRWHYPHWRETIYSATIQAWHLNEFVSDPGFQTRKFDTNKQEQERFYLTSLLVAVTYKRACRENKMGLVTGIWRKSHRSLQPGARQFYYGR